MIARKTNGESDSREGGEGTRGQEMREVDATGGKTNGKKEVRVDVTKRKSITRTMAGRKETGKKGTTEKATLSKGEDVVVCLPGARIEHVTERVENVLGHGQGGSILVRTMQTGMEQPG